MSKSASTQQFNYVALGDSLANGVGAEGNGYPQQLHVLLQSQRPTNLSIFAVSGQTSTQLLQKNHQYRHQLKQANLITINIGGNDLRLTWRLYGNKLSPKAIQRKRMQLAVTTLANNWNELAKLIATQAPQAKIVFLNLYNPYQKKYPATREYVDQANGILHTICSNYGFELLDVRDILNRASKQSAAGRSTFMSDDDLHLNNYGYALIASEIYRIIYPPTIWDKIKGFFAPKPTTQT